MANISRSYSNGSAIKVEYSYTQNVSKNQSTLTMTLYVHRDSYGPSWNYTGSFNISTSWVKIGSTVTKTVTHNADGTKSISITGFFDSQGLTSKLDDLSCSGTVTLKTIPRASSISSITGDTIGETVTIRLSRAHWRVGTPHADACSWSSARLTTRMPTISATAETMAQASTKLSCRVNKKWSMSMTVTIRTQPKP